MTAAEYAEILDPERKVEGWWRFSIYRSQPGGWFKFRTETMRPNLPEDGTYKIYDEGYHGPDDLHTARSEAWRGEEWLEARGCCWFRGEFPHSKTCKTQVYKRAPRTDEFGPSHLLIGGTYTDHAAAIAEAVRRVNDGISN